VNAFSDLEIHHMGTVLADNVSQGGAGGDQFRTAPCGALVSASSCCTMAAPLTCLLQSKPTTPNGSEANQAESNFDLQLTTSQQQDILNFLQVAVILRHGFAGRDTKRASPGFFVLRKTAS